MVREDTPAEKRFKELIRPKTFREIVGVDPPPSGGGGGRTPAPTPTPSAAPSGPSQAELTAQKARERAEQLARQQAEAEKIEAQRKRERFEANKRFREKLKLKFSQAQSQFEKNQLRRKLVKDLEEELAKIQAEAKLKRVEGGIVISTTLRTTVGKLKVTKKNLKEIREAFGLKPGEKKRIIKPEEQIPVRVQDLKGKTFFGVRIGVDPKSPFFIPSERRLIPSGSVEEIKKGNFKVKIKKERKEGKIINLPKDFGLKEIIGTVTTAKPVPGIPKEAFFDPKFLTVEPVFRDPKEKGLLKDLSFIINQATGKKITRILRGEKLSTLGELKLAGLGFAGAITDATLGFIDLPKNLKLLAKNPELALKLPGIVRKEIGNLGEILFISPGLFIGRIGGELVVFKGTSKALKTLGKIGNVSSARLSTKFVGEAKVGSALKITTRTGQKLDIKVVGRIGSKGLRKESIAKQLKLAGRRVKIATSTQADNLITFIRRRRIIRKPIANEMSFSKVTKKLLSQFDRGKISSKRLIKLDKLIKKQSGSGLLERSFFADPKGRLRPSRVSVEKEAGLLDIFSGDVSFRAKKPQVLVFTDIKIQKFPKKLRKIVNKLKNKKTLTKLEADEFLKFQLKKSGKFKALGFASGESEITLAPGEIIKRVKKIGVTIVKGKKVPIVQAKVIKTTGKLKTLITKFKRGTKLTKKELKELNKLFRKKTGSKLKISSPKVSRKLVPVRRIGLSALASVGRRAKVSRKKPRRREVRISKRKRISRPAKRKKRIKRAVRVPKRPPGRPPARPPRRPPRRPGRPPARPPKRPPGRPPTRPPGRPPAKPPTTRIKKFKRRKKPKKRIGYDVFGKRLKGRKIKGKKRKIVWIKINKKPLSKSQAKNRGSYAVDHSLSRQYKIRRVSKVKTRGKLTAKEGGYFKKSRKKFRAFKIRKGKRIPIKRRYIEKKTRLLDTQGERKKITIARLSKQLNRPVRRKVKRVVRKPISRPKPIKKRFIKGSFQAKAFMKKLRAMKGR